jgi:hypothetical protein
MIKCSKCGFISSDGAPDCPRCGDSTSKTIKIKTNKPSKTLDLAAPSETQGQTRKQSPQRAGFPLSTKRASGSPPAISSGAKFCTACGSLTYPSSKVPGSACGEFILFFLSFGSCIIGLLIPLLFILAIFLFLGFIGYGIWRLTNRRDACTQCGEGQLIPATSPVAMQMMSKIKQDIFDNTTVERK